MSKGNWHSSQALEDNKKKTENIEEPGFFIAPHLVMKI